MANNVNSIVQRINSVGYVLTDEAESELIKDLLSKIRKNVYTCACLLNEDISQLEKYDKGRLIAAVDMLGQVAEIATQSVLIPISKST